MSATRYLALPEPFAFTGGGHLSGARLAYETWGTLRSARDNAVLILTGMSPGAHAASSPDDQTEGWWEAIIGPGKAIDTDRFFVICANNLGSCRGSTGAASDDPRSGTPYRMDFPRLSLEDIARAKLHLLDHLGVARAHAVIGPSMGGMTALALLALAPGRVARAGLLSTAMQATPMAIALRSLQRDIVLGDPGFAGGAYAHALDVRSGMGLARKLGVITYRSADEWLTRFGRARIDGTDPQALTHEFQIEAYLQGHADRWAGSFDPACYLYLSHAMDGFELASHGRPVEVLRRAALESALVIGVATDLLFPLWQQDELARTLTEAGVPTRFAALPSVQGHDSFLVDIERFAPPIRELLEHPSIGSC